MLKKPIITFAGCVPYQDAAMLQIAIREQILTNNHPETLIFLQHPPTITYNHTSDQTHLLLTAKQYADRGITFEETDRGGDMTYHGPGQIIVYPLFNLANHGKDLHIYLRNLEEVVIRTLEFYEIEAVRFPPHTGVWVEEEKICAIGIKVSKWITTHGIALNVDETVRFGFETIVPCGLHDYGITTMQALSKTSTDQRQLQTQLKNSFEKVFNIQFEEISFIELQKAIRK